MRTLLGNLEDVAIDRIRFFAPPDGYWVGYSGGKDSEVLLDLVKRSGVSFEAHMSMIPPLDPPPLIKYVRKSHPEVAMDWPKKPFFEVMKRQGYPTRCIRWCCREFKERGGAGRVVLTGIRWQESHRRSRRRMVESCFRTKSKRYLHPIIDWSETDVWAYIRGRGLSYCSLYDEGFKRLGCVGCPMVQDHLGFERWPHIKAAWRRTFHWLYDNAEQHPKKSIRDLCERWSSADALFEAWLDRKRSLVGDLTEEKGMALFGELMPESTPADVTGVVEEGV